MKILFIHQNFPGQFRYLAELLARNANHQVAAIGIAANLKRQQQPDGIQLVGYNKPKPAAKQTHHYLHDFETAVRHGQAVVRKALELRSRGFVPDLIYAHPGWGEALYIKEAFPAARLILFCEFYYHAQGTDCDFDPEYPTSFDDGLRIRTRNATQLLSLDQADLGISPTQWQQSQYPAAFQDRIQVVHDGINTHLCKPNADVQFRLTPDITLTRNDEVITYVARNLEPYRGFPSLMRALPEILARRPKAQVLIVGGDDVSYGRKPRPEAGSYREQLLREVGDRLDLSRVHFLGKIPYARYLQLLQVSSVHLYLTYPFVLSWSVLEAMACGAVVVGSRTPPVQEVIQDGVTGFLVDFFDAREIADKVDEVLQRSGEWEAIRCGARHAIIERYELQSCLARQCGLLGVGNAAMINPKSDEEGNLK